MLAWLPNHSSSTSEPIQKLSRRPSPRAACHHLTKRSKQLQRRLDSTRLDSRPRPPPARWTGGRRSADLTRHAGRHRPRGPVRAADHAGASPLPPDRAADHAGASDRPAENLSRRAAHKPGPTHAGLLSRPPSSLLGRNTPRTQASP